MQKSINYKQLEKAYNELKIELEEANDIIHAIRSGEVDALVVNGKDGHQLFTLKSADQSYRIFIEQMTEGALTLDTEGRILYCNSRFAELFEMPLEKVIGIRFLDFVPAEDQQYAQEVIDSAWEFDSKTELDLRYKKQKVAVQLSLKALSLDEGTALSVVITDLSELKKNQMLLKLRNVELEEAKKVANELNENLEKIVELRTIELHDKNQELARANLLQLEANNSLSDALDKLKESEDNLQSAFNAGELGNCSLSLKTGRAEMSDRFRKLHGLPLIGDMNMDMLMDIIEPEFVPAINHVLQGCKKEGNPVDMTYPIKSPLSGERRWMRVVGKVKKDNNGEYDELYAIVMDVTNQKQDEQRKNDFIAMVSHELKTPLTSMKGYIQVMQLKAKKTEDGFEKKALEGAERQVTKMTSMINGFLNVSRLESGKIAMDFECVEFSGLLEEVVEEFKTTVNSHRILSTCQDRFFVNVDRVKVGHVISNLISNAIKYSPTNSVVHINCYTKDENAVFSISDQGMGISAKDLPKLFDRFYRVENTHTATVSGFGIGLYLSSEIINSNGGKIWVESELDKGSVFYFSLPLHKPD